jgi:hypothetical protein
MPNTTSDIIIHNNGGVALPDLYPYERTLDMSRRSQSLSYDILQSNTKATAILDQHKGQVSHSEVFFTLLIYVFRYITLNGIRQNEL